MTICTRGFLPHFGDVIEGEMRLSKIGNTARNYWIEIPEHVPNIGLDEFIIMPNHVHGIVIISEAEPVETLHATSLPKRSGKMSKISPHPGSLSSIVRSYKSAVTRWGRRNGFPKFAWQPRFYDHIIRNHESFHEIQFYIRNNPLQWDEDTENPNNRL